MRTLFICVLVLTSATGPVRSQEHRATGVRILSLAGASSALPSDAWAVCANPASLSGNSSPTASAFLLPALYGLPELRTIAVSGCLPISSGAIGASVSRFGFELYSETILSVGCGLRPVPSIALGASVHASSIAIARYGKRLSWTVDIGFVASILEEMWIGAAVHSLWGDVPLLPGGDLPTALSWALSVSPREGTLLIVEAEKDEGYSLIGKIGAELLVVEAVTVRVGVATSPATFSTGCSVSIAPVEFGYAGSLHQDLGWTHALEIRYTRED